MSDATRIARADVTAKLEKMRTWPVDEVVQLVSPIVFSLTAVDSLTCLLDPATKVDFDLRGYGARSHWTWLRPEAGLLVWDPAHTGLIASGQQLFGNYTFQIFCATGYDALAALDDDGDGVLRGDELSGIRVWFDRNGDGRSEATEVVDLLACGIVGIAVRETAKEGVHPMNAAGLIMANGRTRPTWDWMAEPSRN